MAGLHSFQDFTKAREQRIAEEEAQKQTEAREETARSFKDLLAEYGVTKVSELDEEKRGEFFSRLEGTDLNESLSLIEEGTRSFFGKIDKKGNIEAVYMHYDGYPENMLPLIKKGYSGSKRKNIDVVIQNGAGSGLEADPKKINYYNDGMEPMGGNAGYIRNFIGDAKESWAEFIYLYDERDGKWYMADTYEDNDLKPAFETVETSRFDKFVFEATGSFPIEYKRDAKKVVTQYNHLFGKRYTSLVDGGNMQLGAIKVIFQAAMEDANFSREGNSIAKNIKGSLSPIITKPSGLGNIEVKVSADRIKVALYNEASRISNAAGWGGQGIVEGTAMYLDSIGEKTMAAKLIADFHAQFESREVLEARLIEGNEFGAARAKAIADGEDEFEVDGEKYKVTKVDKEDEENAEDFAGESTVNEWGSSDQSIMNQQIHKDAGSPKKMPSPFDKRLRDAAEDAVDWHWDDWPEYKRNRAGLIDDAVRGYLRSYFKKDFEMMVKMFEPMESVVTEADTRSMERSMEKAFKKKGVDIDVLSYDKEDGGFLSTYDNISPEELLNVAKSADKRWKWSVTGPEKSVETGHFLTAYFENTQTESAVEVSEGLNKSDVQYQLSIAYTGNTPPKVTKLNKKKLEVRYGYKVDPDHVIDSIKTLYPEVELKHVEWRDIMSGGGVHSFDINESVTNEAEVKSDEEFKEYAFTVLQKAFGDKFDEEKAQEIVDGLISKHDGDYGAMVGALQTSLG
jgi:hypothetical protein